ncbi:MAG: alpha-amylase family glycosyl hydrolase, partial [Pyrinomonadaceae bacterium]
KREYPNMNVVGEVLDGDPAHVAFFQGGRVRFDGVDSRLDTLFDFPLFYPLRRAFAEGKSIVGIPQTLGQDQLYPNPSVLVTLLGNHDVGRFMGEPGATTAGLKLAQTLIMTTRGAPQLYYGDEIALPGGGDPDNRRDFPGGFPGDARSAFERAGRGAAEQRMYEWTRDWIRLRREHAAIRGGAHVDLVFDDDAYAFARRDARETIVVAINRAAVPKKLRLPAAALEARDGAQLVPLAGVTKAAERVPVAGDGASLTVAPRSAVAYRLAP